MPEDTIAACATPPGGGLRAVVRLSGPRALDLARGRAGAVLMPAPRTYTREDMAELHGPGSAPLVAALLADLVRLGARPARPGEFTLRAFLNGRLDLARAEAVERVIAAEGESERRAALEQLRGGFSRRLLALEQELLDLCADAEAGIDFVDQDIELLPFPEARRRADRLAQKLLDLRVESAAGGTVPGRPRVVLYGAPNAGKSTLFNVLSGSAAIVSELPGTTRDLLEADAELGVPVRLVDTAGDREAGGIEGEAVRRSRSALEGADLVLVIGESDGAPAEPRGVPVLRVRSKCDLSPASTEAALRVSAKTGEGIDELRRAVGRRLAGAGGPGARFRVSVRQQALLEEAGEALSRTAPAGLEFLAADLRAALVALGGITGREVDEALLDRIFSRFCLGK